MQDFTLTNLSDQVKKTLEPFLRDIFGHCKEDVLSLYVIGSAVTKDFHPRHSDINTLLVVNQVNIPLFDYIAILGKRYGKKKIRAPLIMTHDYIIRSLEVFPLEFLEMKLVHLLVYGSDVLKDIRIGKADIRHQCERELKGKLQHLCQGYIRAMGSRKALTDVFVGSLSGYFPVLRGLLFLYDQRIPQGKNEVLSAMEQCFTIDMSVYRTLLGLRVNDTCPSLDTLREIFEKLYRILDIVIKKVDEFEITPA
ncbi:MAG: hypothetical protein DCC43_06425 [Candidatus Brocadia sp.]|jgi:hypothetical protein|nr:hypothetical protein [Candidatus Brocadia fulgida]MCC6326107.1 hypothetical protein [Candidatus Brocadia sp.]MCE7911565.1 hypothetical protein [Candidatus Brocadia sp. AMX3]OQZ02376.1 MAG: hypothetical protein B6D35_01355 [Candidatus Brocadia sp. UTAMX2]MDG5997600.1 hypothetical protein [Candidatus Brocadia sp.]